MQTEQQTALEHLRRRHQGDQVARTDPPLSSFERARLLALAVRVVAEAASLAEAECQRILLAAATEAEAVVKRAHEEVAHMTEWLSAAVTEAGDATPDLRTPRHEPLPPEAIEPEPDATGRGTEDDRDDIGAAFFASFAAEDPDRWSFMDDDNLVGVAPAVRRLLRRPNGWRDQDNGATGALP